MKIGIAPHPLWPAHIDDFDQLVPTAVRIEQAGFDHTMLSSHLLNGELGPTPEPLIALAAIAAATTRLRLVTSVLILPLYASLTTAHQTATLHRISGGRLTLGVGVGWDRDEFTAAGAAFEQRGAIADQHLTEIIRLWTPEPAATAGPRRALALSLDSEAKPAIWVGGESDAALRRALRYADGWHGALNHQAVAPLHRRIEHLARQLDRDPAQLSLHALAFLVPPGFQPTRRPPVRLLGGSSPTQQSVRHEAELLREAGVASLSLWMPVAPAVYPDAVDWVARALLLDRSSDGRQS
jgi:alkanesulfonate monooxygenase SsuD/methylene tetrahydromethanopterin reductase-like flavin-dependent oxidoreductase (luciferase family)